MTADQIGYGKTDFLELKEKDTANITIPCDGCFSCTDCCPMNIPIPKFFMVYSLYTLYEDVSLQTVYSELLASGNGPSDCIRCGRCEEHCPKHLGIVGFLQDVDEEFEDL